MLSLVCDCPNNGYNSVPHCVSSSHVTCILPFRGRTISPIHWDGIMTLTSRLWKKWHHISSKHDIFPYSSWKLFPLALYLTTICGRPKLHGEAAYTVCIVQLTA